MRRRHVLLAIAVALVWGINFLVIKLGLDAFPPLLFSALRFTCAAIPAVFFLDRAQIPWRLILGVGLVLGVAKYSLLFLGIEAGMPAGLASLAIQAQVPFTIVLAAVALREMPSRLQRTGVAIALGGIALIATTRGGDVSLTGLALVVGAAGAWAVANLLIKRSGGVDPFRLMVWMSLVPPLPLFALSLVFEHGQWAAIAGMGAAGLGAIVYTGLVATVIAFGVWGGLLKRYPASAVTPFALLVPVFGMASSTIFLGERLTAAGIAAMALVLVGLATVVLGPRLSAALATSPSPVRTAP